MQGTLDFVRIHLFDGVSEISAVTIGAAGEVQFPFAEKTGVVEFYAGALGPDIAEVFVQNLEFDVNIVLGAFSARGHGGNARDLADVESHEFDVVANGEAGAAVGISIIAGFDGEPTFAF